MDKALQREQAKLRMRRKRNKERNKIQEDVTQGGENVTQITPEVEMVPALGMLPERPRYLTLSDGQILDRANLPKATKQLTVRDAISMAKANRSRIMDQAKADRYKRWLEGKDVRLDAFKDKEERGRLQRVCASLSHHNVLDRVYLGCGSDPVRVDEVAELLT